MGKVVVRFPPEASGYLHIGHAKAALLNQMYALRYNGKLILRFDDTNCNKEKTDFEHVILEDLKLLGIAHDQLSFTSNHFEALIQYADQLIREGKAYCDDTDGNLMKEERLNRIEGKNRNNTVEKNLEMWEAMKQGSDCGLKTCLRAKIDMKSDNGCMRDPVMYRCNLTPHPRLGSQYKAYPTYDFACPIVDSLEGVTHALRTTEYKDREAQFYWFLDALNLRKPIVWDYSRLNMVNTVMSKRKLTWFVEQNFVDGWDDPRFPTVRGILRRGMTLKALKEFIWSQGASRSINFMEWDKIWAINKRVLDPIAPRFTGLEKKDIVPLCLTSKGPEAASITDIAKHKKNPDLGSRKVTLASDLFLEQEDAKSIDEGEEVTLMDWGNAIITKIQKNTDTGLVERLEATLNLEGDFKKTKKKLTWLAENESALPLTKFRAVHYDYLITKAKVEEDDQIESLINPNSKVEIDMCGDYELRGLKKGDIVQLQRKAFYICDREYDPSSDTSLVLIRIPDGKQTESKPANAAASAATAGAAPKSKKPQLDISTEGLTKQERKRLEKEAKAAEKAAKKATKVAAQPDQQVASDAPAPTTTLATTPNETKAKDAASPKASSNSTLPKKTPQAPVTSAPKHTVKKVTKLGLSSAKDGNFSEWYTDLIVKAELIEYYDVSGCYILRPAAYSIWERIQSFLDKRFKACGIENCYFPMFISNRVLQREKDHIADFAPEVAWITKSGETDLAEPIAIRPTSETAMYPAFAKWIQSHRDLPLNLNQWNNVVRWEFKHPQPFLRTREFLWQEGHSAFATPEELAADVEIQLESYRAAYEDLLAVPVIKGRKSDKEKFAGGDYTSTVEAFVPSSGRGIQAATSHFLGQNFAKMFDITVEDAKAPGTFTHVWQGSFGFTTRSIGVMIMVHGDDKGLVLPPRVASLQVVLVPCGLTNKVTEEEKQGLYARMREVNADLLKSDIRARFDDRENVNVGWKFNHWELKGVPLRMELGLRDLQQNKCTFVRRDTGDKIEITADEQLPGKVAQLLETIQHEMFARACEKRDAHLAVVNSLDQLNAELVSGNFAMVPWCKGTGCEDTIKIKTTVVADTTVVSDVPDALAPAMGAKSLCIPYEQKHNIEGKTCIICEKPAQCHGLFGRSY